MDSVFYPDIKKIYGIDLSDYFIDKNSYNPIVYIHKKYLPKEKPNETEFKHRTYTQYKDDKCQQFDYDKIHNTTYETKIIDSDYRDPLVDQTIRFAKDIIPITIPPSTNLANPVYYTIKSCKKNKKKSKQQEYKENNKDATFDKEQSKHTIGVKQGKCKRNRDSLSATSATHFSPNNTMDDINENQSLSYSLSEISERKHYKREDCTQKNNRHGFQKIVASDSFEAIATEYMQTPADSKIKIHLMNEKDKHLLCENIRSPVIKAIKECFVEFSNKNESNIEMQNLYKAVRYHADTLDNVLDKLTCIENKLELLTKSHLSPKIEVNKTSKLEEIAQDILNVKEDFSSEEELACVNFATKSRGKNTPATPMYSDKDAERDIKSIDNLARGENIPEYLKASSSQLGIKPERSNRIPTRFCWTDVMKN